MAALAPPTQQALAAVPVVAAVAAAALTKPVAQALLVRVMRVALVRQRLRLQAAVAVALVRRALPGHPLAGTVALGQRRLYLEHRLLLPAQLQQPFSRLARLHLAR